MARPTRKVLLMVRSLEFNLKAAITRTFPRITSNASKMYTTIEAIVSTSPFGRVGRTCGTDKEVGIGVAGVELLFIFAASHTPPFSFRERSDFCLDVFAFT